MIYSYLRLNTIAVFVWQLKRKRKAIQRGDRGFIQSKRELANVTFGFLLCDGYIQLRPNFEVVKIKTVAHRIGNGSLSYFLL